MLKAFFIACLPVLLALPAKAQMRSFPTDSVKVMPQPLKEVTTLKGHARKVWDDAKLTGASIGRFRQENKALVNLGIAPVALGTAWYTTYRGLDKDIKTETQEDRSPVKGYLAYNLEPLGRSIYWMPIWGGMMAYGVVGKDPLARKTAFIGFSALLVNNMVTGHLKSYFNRHRPNSGATFNVWDGPDRATGQHHSFPSSHTSTAFTAATVLAISYKDKPLVPILAYTLATSVGLSRIYDNHHWASDVLAGAVVGIVNAKLTYAAYNFMEKTINNKVTQKRQLIIMPQVGMKSVGLTGTMAF